MTAPDWNRIKDLLHEALKQPASERAAFLDTACNDATTRREVEALLAAHERAEKVQALKSPFAHTSDLEPDADPDPAITGQQVGPYRLVRELGRGGMGNVYLAERADGQFQQTVALKLIRRGLDTDDILSRFAFERQILAGLDHPHIARLYDGGVTDDGRPYFAMEYVQGEPITDYCDRVRLNTPQRLALFRTVCRAVQHAHQNLVVHRDLKPSNILVTEEGTVKLLDFGIAKLLSEETEHTAPHTRTGLRLMTPEYAAPEQIRHEPITTATDVYQLGMLLYELLTGHLPYRLTERMQHEIERVILEEEPTRPSTAIKRTAALQDGIKATRLTPERISAARSTTADTLQRRLVGDLDTIVLTALKKEPSRRYASVEQLAEDVRRHLHNLPVTARPDTFGYRASRFVRRNRVGVAATTTVVLALVVGLGAALWQSRIAVAERNRAQKQAAKAEAVSDFLDEVLTAADGSWFTTSDVAGPNVTVAAVLDAAATRLEQKPLDDPLVEASVRRSIGTAYRSLSRLQEAQVQLERSVALLRAHVRPPHADLAMSLHELGAVHFFRTENVLADSLLREALAQWRATHEEPDRWLFAFTNDAGLGLQSQGYIDKAEPYFEEAVRLSRIVPDVPVTGAGAALTNLVRIRMQQRRYHEADSLLREILALHEEAGEAGSYERFASMYTAADIARLLGRYTEADSLARVALDGLRTTVGEESPYYTVALLSYAAALIELGRYAEANVRAEESLRRALALWPPESELHARARMLRGMARSGLGQLEAGEADLRYALERYHRMYERPSTSQAIASMQLAENLQRQGRTSEAETLLRRALEIAEASATRPDDLLVARVRDRLRSFYEVTGQTEQAAALNPTS